ncbi:MAG: hypothetical protein WC895_01165 [Candidatus Shapirobacteria bacterium]|jgi:hypothetical protein
MQVYFIASSRLVEKNREVYSKMYNFIATDYKMVSDKVKKWVKMGTRDLSGAPLRVKLENYKEIMKCVGKADIIMMEISGHSMSMGYLVSKALEINKPIIALYTADHKPVFIKGIINPKLILTEYNEENLEKVIEEAFNKAKCLIDVRFNFFVSPKILTYLDWIGQKKMTPKSVFLRNLIEKEIKKDKEFKG